MENGEDRWSVFEVALAAWSSGDLSEAIRLMIRLTERYPGEVTFVWVLGDMNLQAGELDNASRLYRQALFLDPTCRQAWDGLADVYVARKEMSEAEAMLHQRLAIRKDPGPLLRLASVKASRRRYVEAVELARECLSLDPTNGEASFLVGVWSTYLDDLATARRAFKRALAIDPKSSKAQCELGFLEYGVGNTAVAIRELEQATQLDPELKEAHFYLALALKAAGKLNEARSELVVALDLCEKQSDRELYEATFKSAVSPPSGFRENG